MEKKIGIEVAIREINEISFNLNPIPIPIEQIKLGENLNLGMGFRFDVDIEMGVLKFYTLVHYSISEQLEPIIKLESEIIFEIKNLSLVVSQEDVKQLKIENGFLETLAGVCIGTTRGLLASNLKGSPMAKFPLPILIPKEIIGRMNDGSWGKSE